MSRLSAPSPAKSTSMRDSALTFRTENAPDDTVHSQRPGPEPHRASTHMPSTDPTSRRPAASASPGDGTFVTETRRRDFVDSVNRANICADPPGHRMPPAAPLLNIGRCELAPTTAVRLRARVKYSKRFRTAYGDHRSRPGLPPRSPRTMSLAPRTGRTRDDGLPVTVTSLARPRCSHRQPFSSLSIASTRRPNRAAPDHERGQEVRSRLRRFVETGQTCAGHTRTSSPSRVGTLLSPDAK